MFLVKVAMILQLKFENPKLLTTFGSEPGGPPEFQKKRRVLRAAPRHCSVFLIITKKERCAALLPLKSP